MRKLSMKPAERRMRRVNAIAEGWFTPNASGLCQCGCGESAPLARKTARDRGHLAGEPMRFLRSHQPRVINVTHGQSRTPLYAVWKAMRARCENPNIKAYAYYGALGVKVCDRWQSFENFHADVGDRPPGLTLDRIDPSGDYEPGNVRWATWHEQRINRRRT